MKEIDFMAENLVEHRSDNPNSIYYWVILEDKNYCMAYENDKLKEVYIMDYPHNYFMSCRIDMKTISHYYAINNGSEILRYEEGKLNRVYTMKDRYTTIFERDGVKVIYKKIEFDVQNKKEQLYNDLIKFLKKFNELKLFKLFQPNKPE